MQCETSANVPALQASDSRKCMLTTILENILTTFCKFSMRVFSYFSSSHIKPSKYDSTSGTEIPIMFENNIEG